MPKRPLILFSLVSVLLALVVYKQVVLPPSVQAQRSGTKHFKKIVFAPTKYEPQRVLDAQPAIVHPPHVSAEEGNKKLRANELVIGLVVDGEARAYPINMLTGPRREIFNDKLGEHDIAATW